MTTAAGVLVDTLHAWGINTIFGIPGDGINGIMDALTKRAGTIHFFQVRHEEAVAFVACAYAKYTGRLGCCLATPEQAIRWVPTSTGSMLRPATRCRDGGGRAGGSAW
jgi:glyoxylate carboligase